MSVYKLGSGTTILTASNTYTGATTINSGTLSLSNAVAPTLSGTTSIQVNTGGTLLLSGSTTWKDRVGNATAVTLAGGTFDTGGLSEGSTAAAGLGVLTLTANSILDLGAGSSVLHFAASNGQTWTPSTTLRVYDWTGNKTGGGTDQLLFGSSPSALTSTQLSQIRFYSDAGTTYLGSGIFAATNNGEVTYDAIPEPATVWTALGLSVMAVLDFRRRRGQLHRVGQNSNIR